MGLKAVEEAMLVEEMEIESTGITEKKLIMGHPMVRTSAQLINGSLVSSQLGGSGCQWITCGIERCAKCGLNCHVL